MFMIPCLCASWAMMIVNAEREEAELKKQLNPEKPPDQRVSPEGSQELICYHGAEREEAELK